MCTANTFGNGGARYTDDFRVATIALLYGVDETLHVRCYNQPLIVVAPAPLLECRMLFLPATDVHFSFSAVPACPRSRRPSQLLPQSAPLPPSMPQISEFNFLPRRLCHGGTGSGSPQRALLPRLHLATRGQLSPPSPS